ncbi:hypothetical protein KKC16_02155 [Patescibacteria group bacterium]|nr:hypothetical protein [Patescibacteria group bacterium]
MYFKILGIPFIVAVVAYQGCIHFGTSEALADWVGIITFLIGAIWLFIFYAKRSPFSSE